MLSLLIAILPAYTFYTHTAEPEVLAIYMLMSFPVFRGDCFVGLTFRHQAAVETSKYQLHGAFILLSW